MFDKEITRILYCYGVWDEQTQRLEQTMNITFHEGVPTEDMIKELPAYSFVILDDLISEIVHNKFIESLFLRLSHHLKLGVLIVTQNLFYQGSVSKSISLNQHYLVLLKSPRDINQLSYLGSQLGASKALKEIYHEVMSKPYSHLVINLSPHTNVDYKFLSNVFSNNEVIAYKEK